jgi:hypothetical protein
MPKSIHIKFRKVILRCKYIRNGRDDKQHRHVAKKKTFLFSTTFELDNVVGYKSDLLCICMKILQEEITREVEFTQTKFFCYTHSRIKDKANGANVEGKFKTNIEISNCASF